MCYLYIMADVRKKLLLYKTAGLNDRLNLAFSVEFKKCSTEDSFLSWGICYTIDRKANKK